MLVPASYSSKLYSTRKSFSFPGRILVGGSGASRDHHEGREGERLEMCFPSGMMVTGVALNNVEWDYNIDIILVLGLMSAHL